MFTATVSAMRLMRGQRCGQREASMTASSLPSAGGISLSPAIVIGYLMWRLNWTSDAALQHVLSKRYCVAPGPLLNQLKEYESIYVAQKIHAMQGQQPWDAGCSVARRKRQVEE